MGSAVAAIAIGLVVTGLASAEGPVRSTSGNLEGVFNAGLLPDTLAKKKPSRASFTLAAKFRTLDGSHPPALRDFRLEADEHVSVAVKGIPTCGQGDIRGKTSRAAEAACRSALIGSGMIGFEVTAPMQRPLPKGPRLLVFNGGVKNGVTTLYVHTYLEGPVSAALIATVKIRRVRNRHLGLLVVAKTPQFADGNGSITSFNLNLTRGVFASCPDRSLDARATAAFADGARLEARFSSDCTPTRKRTARRAGSLSSHLTTDRMLRNRRSRLSIRTTMSSKNLTTPIWLSAGGSHEKTMG